MKKLTIKLITTLLCFLFISQLHAKITEIDSIAAVVNNDIISVTQLKQRAADVSQQLAAQGIKRPPQENLMQQVLQMLINQSLVDQMAQRMNITATTDDIKHAIASIAAEKNINTEQLRDQLQQQGISEAAFIKQLKQQIISQKLLRETVASQITVTPQEINAGVLMAEGQAGQHNEYHLLHILVSVPDSPSPEQIDAAEKKADDIITQLKHGESFKTLAAEQSVGSQMFNGGDMGWKSPNELPTVFANRVLTMKKNQIVGPIQTANGFHIIKLIGIRGKQFTGNQEQLKQQVAQMIFQRKLAEKQQDWISQLRATAYIKIYYHPKLLPTPDL